MKGQQRAVSGAISTHALTWRATCTAAGWADSIVFLPTPSHGGRLKRSFSSCFACSFLPTPSHGGRRQTTSSWQRTTSISTHALTWRATIVLKSGIPHLTISTHALTWRATCAGYTSLAHNPISTHALTWRATNTTIMPIARMIISTHALTWRATATRGGDVPEQYNFYPRPHMEGDHLASSQKSHTKISTHALTWRATH